MILKKLRYKRNWSQEQLAELSGLSVRTVQRIEAGGKANLESLKCLASVLEVDVSTLEREIPMIDKTSEDWQKVPFWLRGYFYGSGMFKIPERKWNIRMEQFSVTLGLLLLAASPFYERAFDASFVLFTTAYILSVFTRAGDKYSIW